MLFTITLASDYDYEREIEINSLEELQTIKERLTINNPEAIRSSAYIPPYRLIVDFEDRVITIYDYYIE